MKAFKRRVLLRLEGFYVFSLFAVGLSKGTGRNQDYISGPMPIRVQHTQRWRRHSYIPLDLVSAEILVNAPWWRHTYTSPSYIYTDAEMLASVQYIVIWPSLSLEMIYILAWVTAFTFFFSVSVNLSQGPCSFGSLHLLVWRNLLT